MAEKWNNHPLSDRRGHPVTSTSGQGRVRDGPVNQNIRLSTPVQETVVEEDGSQSLHAVNAVLQTNVSARPVASPHPSLNQDVPARQTSAPMNNAHMRYKTTPYHAQSVSGFSTERMNIPSAGNLRELPPSNSFRQFLPIENDAVANCVVADPHGLSTNDLFQQAMRRQLGDHAVANCVVADPHGLSTNDLIQQAMRRHLGDRMYDELYRKCYESHIIVGRDPTEAAAYASQLLLNRVQCLLCYSRGFGIDIPLQHALNCPVRRQLQRISQPTFDRSHVTHFTSNGNGNIAAQGIPHPRPEHIQTPSVYEDQVGRTVYQTAIAEPTANLAAEEGSHPVNARPDENVNLPPSEQTLPKCPNKQENSPDYANVIVRFGTFKKWPRSSSQNPRKLAKAGFLYEGTSDHCKCFDCGVELRDWEANDDPFEQHELWSPDCPFVQRFRRPKEKETEARPYHDVTAAISKLNILQTDDKSLPDHINPDICGVCCKEKIEVIQFPCGHIVCRKCLPAKNSEKKYLCRLCGEEVVKTAAQAKFCRKPNS